jgi:RNA polymerase sigma factor (sigma-70 family)
VGRGTSGGTLAPRRDREAGEPADSDRRLVAAVRRGDDRAFEALYQRYQRRIHAYVLGMVKDHGRAEDVTQEVFVSALRRMRETEQPLAFKPWLYQIAKNSCIDAFRRAKRAEEVSYDADDALALSDHSRLVGAGPSPDAAVAAKQDLDNLCGAFGGLSETHHEILVLRELEGLSYQQIGKRMGMSRPAVESTLFRARRRLTEEYDDIVSGARCLRIQQIIVTALESRLGTRDTRRLARHLSHCQSCRREALAAGLDRSLFTRPSVRERVATRVAGFLPLPAFLKFRRGGSEAAAVPPSGRWSAHLPMLTDQLSSGWGKAAAGAAVVVAGVGAGAGVHKVASPPAPDKPAIVRPAKPPGAATAPAKPSTVVVSRDSETTTSRTKEPAARRASKESRRKSGLAGGSASPAAAGRATSGGGPVQTSPGSSPQTAASESSSQPSKRGSSEPKREVTLPAAGPQEPVTTRVDTTVDETTDAVQDTTQQTTQTVDDAVQTVTGDGPAQQTVDDVTDTVDEAVGAAGETVDGVAGDLGGGTGG